MEEDTWQKNTGKWALSSSCDHELPSCIAAPLPHYISEGIGLLESNPKPLCLSLLDDNWQCLFRITPWISDLIAGHFCNEKGEGMDVDRWANMVRATEIRELSGSLEGQLKNSFASQVKKWVKKTGNCFNGKILEELGHIFQHFQHLSAKFCSPALWERYNNNGDGNCVPLWK